MLHLFEIFFRVTFIYCAVLIGLRLTGKREVGQMTPFDFVLLLLLANAVQNAMTGPDTSLLGGIVAGITLLGINTFITRVAWRHEGVRKMLEGTPTLLVENGVVLAENLEKEQLPREALEQILREHGVSDIAKVQQAMLEVDGTISVIKTDESATTHQHRRLRFMRKRG